MKKSLLALTVLVGFSSAAHCYTIDVEACAGTEYIYDNAGELVIYDPTIHTHVTASTPVFYAGKENISHMLLGSTRSSQIIVSNVSDRLVNFRYRPKYISESTGQPSTISPESFLGAFSVSNSPLNNGGALLDGGYGGRIALAYNSTLHYGTATIHWDSSVCGVAPIVATVETQYIASSRAGISVEHINDGNPF